MNKIFQNNPQLDAYFETSDGMPFYTENAAKNHAKDLKDKEVKRIERDVEVVEDNSSEAPEYDMSMTRSELDKVADFYEVDTSKAAKKQDVIDLIDARLKGETPETTQEEVEGDDVKSTTEKTQEKSIEENKEESDEDADSETKEESKD